MEFVTKLLSKKIPYTGVELRPHWNSEQTGEFASSMVAFIGPCDVKTSELVDLEDSRAGDHIKAKEMLHFMAEHFEDNLSAAVLRQRLMIALFSEILRLKISPKLAARLYRDGDDLFIAKGDGKPKKLTVSIVTASPVSTLLHFGVNIDASGAPVSAIGLKDLGVEPRELAKDFLAAWEKELSTMSRARCKVVPRV